MKQLRRIEITKTIAPSGAISYSYGAELNDVESLKTSDDMTFAIAFSEDESLPLATEFDKRLKGVDSIKVEVRERLKAERNEIITAPINNFQVATPEDRENIQGYLQFEVADPIEWTMADNTFQLVYVSDLQTVLNTYVQRKMLAYEAYANACRALDEASTQAMVDAIHMEVTMP